MQKSISTRQLTAQTTQQIMDHQFKQGASVSRNNTLPVPVVRNRVHLGFRSGGRSGRPDIESIYRYQRSILAVPILIEVKTGKDKLSEIQVAYLSEASTLGAVVIVAKDYTDYLEKWANVMLMFKLLFD